MTYEEFEALVRNLESKAQASATLYRTRVFGLALLGYAYLALIVLLVVGALAISLLVMVRVDASAWKLVVPLVVFLGMLMRALWVRIEPPGGIELRPEDTPALHREVELLRRRLQAPRFHKLLLTADFNAAVAQVPRLGLLGWYRNYLILGLPLMKTLTVDQFRAVLAHELGHLAGGHGRLGNWVYRLRLAWSRLSDELNKNEHWGRVLFRWFFESYAPYFNAYSFPLARANEYEADATAARLVSADSLAQALTALNVVGACLHNRYWPGVYAAADDAPEPELRPYTALLPALRSHLDEPANAAWLAEAMEEETSLRDTHPALKDRLRALGCTPLLRLPQENETADQLLGAVLPALCARLDEEWQSRVRTAWTEHHEKVRTERSHYAALSAAAASAELPPEDAAERARLEVRYGAGREAALAQLRALHARVPADAYVCFLLGRHLLEDDDEGGVALMRQSMESDAEAYAPGCELLRDFYGRRGHVEEARAWHGRLVEHQQMLEEARDERDNLRGSDVLEAHGIDEAALDRLRQQVAAIPTVGSAYFARKRVKHAPERPCYVLGYTLKPWWHWRREQLRRKTQSRILDNVAFPGESFVLNVEGDNRSFLRKLRAVPVSRLF